MTVRVFTSQLPPLARKCKVGVVLSPIVLPFSVVSRCIIFFFHLEEYNWEPKCQWAIRSCESGM